MKQDRKAQSHHTKKSDKKPLNKRRFSLTNYIDREAIPRIVAAVVLLIITVGAIPTSHTFTKNVTVPFDTEEKEYAELELGDSQVIQEGRDGKKSATIESSQSLWGRLFGFQPVNQKETGSTITEEPVNKIVANGTRKYQYMLCSDGSSRYYTDEQFKDPDTGFTSKSEDLCKKNGQGHKINLSNSSPLSNSTTSANRAAGATRTNTYEADKINRETEKLQWCSEQHMILGNEYMDKVRQAQEAQGITSKEFNAIVDPAHWKYHLNVGLLRASGCTINNAYPNFVRK